MNNFLAEIKIEILNLQNQSNDAVSGIGGFEGYRFRDLLLFANGSFLKGYHIEFDFYYVNEARDLCDELAQHDIFANVSGDTPNVRVYIKDSESICNLLALVGAQKSLYRLNDEIALRSVVNISNRRANCDTHNLNRQVETARAQVDVITKLDLKSLPLDLQQTAKARIKNPTATYDELAQILGISKSGVVHRLRRLMN